MGRSRKSGGLEVLGVRRWWWVLPAAGVLLLAAACSGRVPPPATTTPTLSAAPMTSKLSAFTVCARDPNWKRPSIERQAEKIRSDPRYNGFDSHAQQAFESHFWRDIGSASGQGAMYLLSGLWTSNRFASDCQNPDVNHLGLLNIWILGYKATTVSVSADEVRVDVSEADGFEMIETKIPADTFASEIPVVFLNNGGKEVGWIGRMRLTSISGVAFRVCASDPNWVRPSLEWVVSEMNPMFYYIRGASEGGIRAGYERRIYDVIPGNSVNQGWLASSGLRGVIDPFGCSNAGERQAAQGRLALYALARYEPVGATRSGDTVVVQVRELTQGWTDLELTLEPPLGDDYSISFVDESGAVVAVYDSQPDPTPTPTPAPASPGPQ